MDKRLTEHFTLGELVASDLAARNGIDNSPSPAIEENLKRVANTLEAVRTIYNKPLTISSGYRCPEVNKLAGGSDTSAHMEGLAADINVPGVTPYELGKAILASGIPFDQMIFEYDSWVHIAIPAYGNKPRMDVRTKRKGTPYLSGWLK
jgi:hypothetical protein